MKTKLYCSRCGEELWGDGGYCFCCHEDRNDAQVVERHFPDAPKNRVYAVDVYVTVCKCVEVEAESAEAAIADVEKREWDGEFVHQFGCPYDVETNVYIPDESEA